MALVQVVYGQRLVTPCPVPFLQLAHVGEGIADGSLAFEESLDTLAHPACKPWYPKGDREAEYPELVGYHEPGSHLFHFCYDAGTTFTYDHHRRHLTATWSPPQTFEDTCTYLVGPILGFVLQIQQRTCLHASTVVLGQEAIAFVGPSGIGKSTLAAGLLRRGAEILTEDVAAIERRTEGFEVHMGPRAIRLWSPSVTALYGRPDALPCISQHWEKRYLPLASPVRHQSARLASVYVLQAVPADAPLGSTQLPPLEALTKLLANIYPDQLPLPEARAAILDTLTQLVTTVPVSCLSLPNSFSRLDEVCDYLLARHG